MFMEQFKRTQVVMLPTKEYTSLILIGGKLEFRLAKDKHFGGQHLSFLSDDKIEKGDWFLPNKHLQPRKCIGINEDGDYKSEDGLHYDKTKCKKIIATTDKSLGWSNLGQDEEGRTLGNSILGIGTPFKPLYPQPSQQFIEKYIESYNKGEVITNILVEYELEDINIHRFEDELKVNPKDNTITIKKLKDSWNREELIGVLIKLKSDVINKHHAQITNLDLEDWTNKNR